MLRTLKGDQEMGLHITVIFGDEGCLFILLQAHLGLWLWLLRSDCCVFEEILRLLVGEERSFFTIIADLVLADTEENGVNHHPIDV